MTDWDAYDRNTRRTVAAIALGFGGLAFIGAGFGTFSFVLLAVGVSMWAIAVGLIMLREDE